MEAAPWWRDDRELLGEALAVFAGDWPHEPSDNNATHEDDATSTSTTSTSSSDLVATRRPVKINRSRERQKQEMRELQASVVELEEELLRLRMRQEKRPRLALANTLAPCSNNAANSGALLAWEKATRRQFHARKKAEAVNARLRELVRTHNDVANDLMRVIQRAEAARQEAFATALFPVPDPAFTLSEAASDESLERRLMRLSTQWHLPFSQCAKFNSRDPTELFFFETSVVRDDGIESELEIRACCIFPHERLTFERELWRYFCTLGCTEEDFSLSTESKEVSDTLLGSLRATVSKDGVFGVLDARFMKQQFRNEHGELIIASTTCGRPGLRRTRGLIVEEAVTQVDAVVTEDSWLRILDVVPSTPTATAASPPPKLTCIQNVRRSRIQFNGTDGADRQQVEGVKRFLARLAENEMRWGSEVVERKFMLGPCNPTLIEQ